MTKFQKWMLRRIFGQLVIQGPWHETNIEEVYKLLHEAVANEFNEDSPLGQKYWLRGLNEKVLNIPKPAVSTAHVSVTDTDEELKEAVAKAREAFKK